MKTMHLFALARVTGIKALGKTELLNVRPTIRGNNVRRVI